MASCAARSRAGHYAAQLAAQGHAHSVPLRQSSDVADIALGHVRPPCPRHGHLTSGRPSAAQAPQQHAHQQHRAHINTNSAPRRLCAYHAAQHQHTRGLLRPTSGPIAHASPSTAPSLPRAGHLEALRRPYTSMTSAAAPAVAVVCGSTEPHPHPHPHPRFALHGDTGAPLGGGERLASSLTETTTGRSGSVSLPIEARAGEGGDRSAATAAVTLAQQESLSSTSATAEPQESTCVRPAFSSAHNMDMHGASSDGSVGEGWSAAAHHDPLPAEDDAVHPLGIQSPAVAPGVRDWGEFHRRQVSVREFREKVRMCTCWRVCFSIEPYAFGVRLCSYDFPGFHHVSGNRTHFPSSFRPLSALLPPRLFSTHILSPVGLDTNRLLALLMPFSSSRLLLLTGAQGCGQFWLRQEGRAQALRSCATLAAAPTTPTSYLLMPPLLCTSVHPYMSHTRTRTHKHRGARLWGTLASTRRPCTKPCARMRLWLLRPH